MGQHAGFRGALGLIYFFTVVAFAVVWGAIGGAITLFTMRNGGMGFLVGGLAGGMVGFLVGAYVTGVGHVLLSINDHLEALRKALDEPSGNEKKAA